MVTKEEENARSKLKGIYTSLGFTVWDVNPNAKSPYQLGVNLEEHHSFKTQIGELEDIAEGVAQNNRLNMIIEGPKFAVGGVCVAYVGISHINPELQKRFQNYKKSKNSSLNYGEILEKGFELLEEEQKPTGIGAMLERAMKKAF